MALLSTVSRSNWNLEMLVFAEGGKPEYPEKKPSEQGQEPTTNSIHIRHRVRELNPGHVGGRLRGRRMPSLLPIALSLSEIACSLCVHTKRVLSVLLIYIDWQLGQQNLYTTCDLFSSGSLSLLFV